MKQDNDAASEDNVPWLDSDVGLSRSTEEGDALEATGSLEKITSVSTDDANGLTGDLTDGFHDRDEVAAFDQLEATGALERIESDEGPNPHEDALELQELSDVEGRASAAPVDDAPYSNISEAWEEQMSHSVSHREAKRRHWPILVLVLVILLVGGYAFGVYHYSSRFLPNTSIGRCDVSGLTLDKAKEALKEETAAYACRIELEGLDASITGESIGLTRSEDSMAEQAHTMQSSFAWPISVLSHSTLTVDQNVTFDENGLLSEITKAIDARNQQTLSAADVSIELDDAENLYVIRGSVNGTVADPKAVDETVQKDVRAFEESSTPSQSSTLRAATIDDLPQYRYTVDWANRVRTNDIPILVNGEEKATAEASQNAEWVSVGDGPSVVVDQDAVREWAESTVADAVFYEENWMNHLLDVDAFVSELSTRLATGVVDPIEAPMYEAMSSEGESREKAYQRSSWDSSMGRYIDVDLEAQFARLFNEKGEVIWESAIVSGDTSEGRSTVTGTFEVYNKQTNATLVGLDYDGDGKPDYTSNVTYWMPFYGGYGLHDATWRYSFGGETYSYDGSHGCVNLPYSKAEELFYMIDVGEKVNVHW